MTDWLESIAKDGLPGIVPLDKPAKPRKQRKARKMSGTTTANFRPLSKRHTVPTPTPRSVGPDQQNFTMVARHPYRLDILAKAQYHAGHMLGTSPIWPQHYGLM